MEFLGLIVLATSLSIDSLGIGVSYGFRGIKIPTPAKFILFCISFAMTFVAVDLGKLICSFVSADIAKTFGIIIIMGLGIFVILQSIIRKSNKKEKAKKPKKDTILHLVLKSFGVTIKIYRNEFYCDLDDSKHIDIFEAVYLGIALSADSFTIGLSTAITGFSTILIPIFVSVFQLLFLSIGGLIALRFRKSRNIKSQYFELLSGILLLTLAGIRWFC